MWHNNVLIICVVPCPDVENCRSGPRSVCLHAEQRARDRYCHLRWHKQRARPDATHGTGVCARQLRTPGSKGSEVNPAHPCCCVMCGALPAYCARQQLLRAATDRQLLLWAATDRQLLLMHGTHKSQTVCACRNKADAPLPACLPACCCCAVCQIMRFDVSTPAAGIQPAQPFDLTQQAALNAALSASWTANVAPLIPNPAPNREVRVCCVRSICCSVPRLVSIPMSMQLLLVITLLGQVLA